MSERYKPERLPPWKYVPALKKERTELTLEVRTDSLTGIPNRAAILGRLEQAVAQSARMDMVASAIMIDIDNFKKINDDHGHAVGDKVLKTVAQTLKSSLRANDDIGRLSGEEFLVIMQEKHRKGAALRFAQSLRERIAGLTVSTDAGAVQVTISLGISTRENNEDAEKLLAQADAALYTAKKSGRDRVEVFDPQAKLFPTNGE